VVGISEPPVSPFIRGIEKYTLLCREGHGRLKYSKN